ncbi:hypothetical protein O181_055170 [Austropuccinia psidii MF-1]|uniref:Uncharacterized protein n=1 Tax=Austropuccinia psidii MF-1 TaxID=1389203 RepID=A0A9Q3HV05_9BASI|nr:hypothetical protein [Austropuccinia psidii MF-1]
MPTDFRSERPRHFFRQSPPENPKSSTISTFPSQSANTTLMDFSSTTTRSLGQKTPPVPHCGFLYHQPPGQHIESYSWTSSSIPEHPFSHYDNTTLNTPKMYNKTSTSVVHNTACKENIHITPLAISKTSLNQCHKSSCSLHNHSNNTASILYKTAESSKLSTIITENHNSNAQPQSNQHDECNVPFHDISNAMPKTTQIPSPLQQSIISKNTFDFTPLPILTVSPSQLHESSSTNPKTLTCTVNATTMVPPTSKLSTALQESHIMAVQESFSFTSPMSEVTYSQCKKSSVNPSEPLEMVESAAATILLLSKPTMPPPKNSSMKPSFYKPFSFEFTNPHIATQISNPFALTPPPKVAPPSKEMPLNAKKRHPPSSANPTDAPLQKLEKKVRFTGLENTKQGQSMEFTCSSEILTLPLKQSQSTPTYLPENASSGSGSDGLKTLGSSKLSTTHASHEKGVVYSSEDEELEATQKNSI